MIRVIKANHMDTQFIEEQKKRLLEDKMRIEEELGQFATKNDSGEYSADFPDDLGSERSENANEVEEYTDRLAVENSLEQKLTDINDALERIEQGAYGLDEQTGEPIVIERLEVYPAARGNVTKD